MKISEIMSNQPGYINSAASIRDAAALMEELETGFLPIVDDDKIIGIVTDRDLVKRAIVDGHALEDPISSIKTPKALYCSESDDVNDVLRNMEDNQVQRLVVLNNLQDKDFVGVVSLSDIADHCDDEESQRHIAAYCRHYH